MASEPQATSTTTLAKIWTTKHKSVLFSDNQVCEWIAQNHLRKSLGKKKSFFELCLGHFRDDCHTGFKKHFIIWQLFGSGSSMVSLLNNLLIVEHLLENSIWGFKNTIGEEVFRDRAALEILCRDALWCNLRPFQRHFLDP